MTEPAVWSVWNFGLGFWGLRALRDGVLVDLEKGSDVRDFNFNFGNE